MIPSSFDYVVAESVDHAVRLLVEHGEDAKILSGGHSLLPLLKFRLSTPKLVIDLGRIASLRAIVEEQNRLRLGALVTHHQIEASEAVHRRCPLLAETAGQIGDVQIRNRGTLAGSLAHADPAADWPAAILALGAEVRLAGPKGERSVAARDFFIDMMLTAIAPGEIITEVRVPALAPLTGWAYVKVAQKASGFAIAGVAALLSVDPSGHCAAASVGITGVASRAYRASAVAAALEGKKLNSDGIQAAAKHAADGIEPLDDLHASAAFRAHLARVLTRRALELAVSRVGPGVSWPV
ncbi:MAG: xanthine dehydrogenase family protein subunit M [Acidobacteria bacterium]|nr:xanthine dehydrogenase family protein subunit M [Acidobacteriota bacterium]